MISNFEYISLYPEQQKNWSLILLNARNGQTSVPNWTRRISYLLHSVGPSHVKITSRRKVPGEKSVSFTHQLLLEAVYCHWSFFSFSCFFHSELISVRYMQCNFFITFGKNSKYKI
jgi:hypothetical protein